MNLFISTAWAQAAGGGAAQGPGFSMFVPMILIFVIFYFLMIRPQQKQQKERKAQIAAIQKGDQVIMASGIYAKVVGVADKILTLEIADNVKVKADREGIATVVKPIENSSK